VFAARVRIAGGRDLQDQKDEVVAEHLPAHLGEHRHRVTRIRDAGDGENRHAEEKRTEGTSVAFQVSVVAAFFDSGRRKAGTPLEIASTPVSATAPDEKPRNRMKRPERSAELSETVISPSRIELDRMDAAEPVELCARQPRKTSATRMKM